MEHKLAKLCIVVLVVLTLAAMFLLAFIAGACAHDAPTGWSYPYECCSSNDCREIASTAVSEGAEGYTIAISGETVPYQDTRIRNSPDGRYHWCTVAGKDDTRTICLYVPPKGY